MQTEEFAPIPIADVNESPIDAAVTPMPDESFHANGAALVAAAHGVHDTFSSFLPALLPVLIEKFSMTNTMAGSLNLFAQLPALAQPLIGYIADKRNLRNAVVIAPAVTAICMTFLGISPSIAAMIPLLMLAGLSSAALHVLGPVMSGRYSGSKLGRGMSFWMVGGELGYSLGPLLLVSMLGVLTLRWLPVLSLLGILTSVFLWFRLKDVTTVTERPSLRVDWRSKMGSLTKVLLPASILVLFRSMMHISLTTFLPVLMTNRGASLWFAGIAFSIVGGAGVVGSIFAGTLSDRFGRKPFLAMSFTATPVLMLLFLRANEVWLQIVLLALIGFFGLSIMPVLLALVLEAYPKERSIVSGIYMMITFLLMALASVIIGRLADLNSLQYTFSLSAFVLLIGLPVLLFLPKEKHISKV
jgi:FSR family fosmidomycin resistance protein-like MFS transporter